MHGIVHVLCLNDYPEAVYVSPEDAEQVKRDKNDPEHGRFYHVKSVPFFPAHPAVSAHPEGGDRQ